MYAERKSLVTIAMLNSTFTFIRLEMSHYVIRAVNSCLLLCNWLIPSQH